MTGPREPPPALHAAGGIVLLALVLALELVGCGRKGAPNPPPGVPNPDPRQYPSE